MTHVDLLSDTTYRQQAVRQLHRLLGNANEFPVKSAQIYGLRQIARQQPDRVADFAKHQGARAEKLEHQAEVDFWTLVANLCNPSSDWSIYTEGYAHIPKERREEDIPQRELNQWANEHIPAFFERFCTQCLYRKALIEMSASNREAD